MLYKAQASIRFKDRHRKLNADETVEHQRLCWAVKTDLVLSKEIKLKRQNCTKLNQIKILVLHNHNDMRVSKL